MLIFSHGIAAEDKREEMRGSLENKPWKEKFHHQEIVLDKKLREEALMEEENERESDVEIEGE